MVTVRLYGYFRDCAKKREFAVGGSTVGAVLTYLVDTFDGFGKLLLDEGGTRDELRVKPYVKVMVNGRGIEVLNGVNTKVGKKDEIVIFPPVGGG